MPAYTPIYGLRYPVSTDPVPVMPSDMETLAEQVETTFDLTTGGKKIVPSASGHTNITFDSRGNGTPSTGVGSFTVNNVFTTRFNSYRIHWLGCTHSTGTVVRFSYPNVTAGYYGGAIINRPNNATVTAFTSDNNNSLHTELNFHTATGGSLMLTVYNPAQSGVRTSVYNDRFEFNTTMNSGALGRYVGFVDNTSSVTSFTVSFGGGTITTAGRLTIYGFTV